MSEICPLHNDLSRKIDELVRASGRQEAQNETILSQQTKLFKEFEKMIACHTANTITIKNVEKIVTNGLTKKITDAAEQMHLSCTELGNRLKIVEDFSWFRIPMNKLREEWLFSIFKLIFILFAILLLYHTIDKAVLQLLMKYWGL